MEHDTAIGALPRLSPFITMLLLLRRRSPARMKLKNWRERFLVSMQSWIPFIPDSASTLSWKVDALYFYLSGVTAFFYLAHIVAF